MIYVILLAGITAGALLPLSGRYALSALFVGFSGVVTAIGIAYASGYSMRQVELVLLLDSRPDVDSFGLFPLISSAYTFSVAGLVAFTRWSVVRVFRMRDKK